MEAGGWDLTKVDNAELQKSQATLVFGQMNEPRGTGTCRPDGLTIAEYSGDGDEEGRDILFFIDNIFRFTQAGSEVSAFARSYAFGCGLPAHACDGNGCDAGAHHLHQARFDHVCAGRLRPCG